MIALIELVEKVGGGNSARGSRQARRLSPHRAHHHHHRIRLRCLIAQGDGHGYRQVSHPTIHPYIHRDQAPGDRSTAPVLGQSINPTKQTVCMITMATPDYTKAQARGHRVERELITRVPSSSSSSSPYDDYKPAEQAASTKAL